MEVDFFTPNVAFFVCVNLSRYMKIGENLLNEVPVEKSILVDFDQFITLVNKWKAKWVHEGYSWLKKKNTKTTPVSAVLPPSDLLFLLRGQLQGFLRVLSTKISTNQSNNYGSVHLAMFDHLRVFEIVSGLESVQRTNSEEAERGGGRILEKRGAKRGQCYFNLVFTYVIFNMRDVTISPKYNFEKLLRKLTFSDFID